MTPSWQSAVEVALVGSALAMAASSIALARRVAAARGAAEDLARRVDSLSARLRVVEAGATAGPTAGLVAPPGRDGARRAALPATGRVDAPAPPAPLIAVPSLAAPGSAEAAGEAAAELGRRFGEVWARADSGATASAIAGATGHPVGQVELILGLRRPAGPRPPAPAREEARDG